MSEKKNIDRLFQEKFKDFESEPPEMAWDYIEERLRKKKDRKVIPIWFRFAGAAAVLLIGLLIAYNSGTGKASGQGEDKIVTSPNAKPGDVTLPKALKTKPDDAVVNNGSANGTSRIDNNDAANQPAAGVNAGTDRSVATDDDNRTESGQPRSPKNRNAPNNRPGNSNERVATTERVSSKRKSVAPEAVDDGSYVVSSEQRIKGKKNGKSGAKQPAMRSKDAVATATSDKNQNKLINGNLNDNRTSTGIAQNNRQITDDARNPLNQNASSQNNVQKMADANSSVKKKNAEVTEIPTTSTQAIAAKIDDTKKDSTAVATVEPNALEELLKIEKEKSSVTQNEPTINRWQVTSNVAPIYLSSMSSGSPIDTRFAENSKDYKTKLSYGVGVDYALSKRLSVRSGVNSIALEYDTNDVLFQQTGSASSLQNVNTSLQGSYLDIQSGRGISKSTRAKNSISSDFSGALRQRISYLEVPVELSYKVLNKRFGIDVIGGVSTLFLSENDISLVSSDISMEIGKANNLNTTHFSTNIGVGMRYAILKSLQFKLEPMFKYQINTFSDSGNFKPYFFGVYTGLNYRF